MNIFVLDRDPVVCAQAHCDLHVNKMLLETAQILCTVQWQNGKASPYKPTHKNHPCTVWAGKFAGNYEWLRQLGLALADEFEYRRGKKHKSGEIIRTLPKLDLPKGSSEFAQAVGDCVDTDPVVAYRRYYKKHKASIARWEWKRPAPAWWEEESMKNEDN